MNPTTELNNKKPNILDKLYWKSKFKQKLEKGSFNQYLRW